MLIQTCPELKMWYLAHINQWNYLLHDFWMALCLYVFKRRGWIDLWICIYCNLFFCIYCNYSQVTNHNYMQHLDFTNHNYRQYLGLRGSLFLNASCKGVATDYRYHVVCLLPEASHGPLWNSGSWTRRALDLIQQGYSYECVITRSQVWEDSTFSLPGLHNTEMMFHESHFKDHQ